MWPPPLSSGGIPTRVCFFNAATARQMVNEGIRANLLLGNNVLAHVPDLLSFIEGLKLLLACRAC